jgi:hypothetical protein
MALLCRKLAIGEMNVALIQQPWVYVYGDRIRGLHNTWGMLFSAGPSIYSRACNLVRNTIQAFPLLELCSRDVVTGYHLTEEGALGILLPLHNCPTTQKNHPHRGNYGTSSTIAVGMTYSSLLDVMPMHTSLYGAALASILEEAVYWNIWRVPTLIFSIKLTNLPSWLAIGRRLLI